MKRLVPLAVLFFTLAVSPLCAFHDNKHLIDDVIRMWRSGAPEETIVRFVVNAPGRFDVTFDDVAAMRAAGVPRRVIRVLLEEAEARNDRPREYARAPHRDTDPTPPWTEFYDPWWFLPRYYTPLPRR